MSGSSLLGGRRRRATRRGSLCSGRTASRRRRCWPGRSHGRRRGGSRSRCRRIQVSGRGPLLARRALGGRRTAGQPDTCNYRPGVGNFRSVPRAGTRRILTCASHKVPLLAGARRILPCASHNSETSTGARNARYHVLAWRIEAQLAQDVQVAVYVTAYHQAIRKRLLPFVLAAHALQSKAPTFPRLGVGVVEGKRRVGILETGLEEIHAVVGGRAV
jgi:hypothetical protein